MKLDNVTLHKTKEDLTRLKKVLNDTVAAMPSERIYSLKKITVDISTLEDRLAAHEAIEADKVAAPLLVLSKGWWETH